MPLQIHPLWLLCLLLLAPLAHAELRVVDDSGAEVVLAGPAQRIVSLAPHITETLFAAGLGERVVGAVSYSDYPEAALAIPRVGSYPNIDLEAVLALEPDLVIGWRSGNQPVQLERLRQFGLPVYVSEPHSPEDVATAIERFALLGGTEEQAQGVVADFRARLRALREQYAESQPISVFYQIWNRPLMTINGEHLISQVITLCGGENIFAGLESPNPKVNEEAVLAADPAVIIAGGMGEERPDWVDAWRRWPQLRAVQDDALLFIPPSLLQRHGPRIIDGAERMCAALEGQRTGRHE